MTELRVAGSINFTPSHNPMDYAGIKFNPGDGGPADTVLTSLIEEKANALMAGDSSFRRAVRPAGASVFDVDAASMFTRFIEEKSEVFDLPKLRGWLERSRDELFILIDTMHGSSRGYIESLLGEKTLAVLRASGSIEFINTNDDYSFHGVKPEPSAANQRPLIESLARSGRRLTLAAALDPDADRIRFADATMDLEMNRFAAIAYSTLLAKGLRGAIASTAPSSDFPLEIARQNGLEAIEGPVGFKNFREPLSSGRAVLAFEESDGISFRGHTLEKCAIGGFLAALDAIAFAGIPLHQQFAVLQKKYGYFYPERSGADVRGVSVEEWQVYKGAVLEELTGGMFRAGGTLRIGGVEKAISQVNTTDGLKLIFDDRSWILLRPSGTEPKFRYYYELASDAPVADVEGVLEAYRSAAAGVLDRARKRAGSSVR